MDYLINMSNSIAKKISNLFSKNDRFVKSLDTYVKKINAIEPEMEKLSDKKLRDKTKEFKERIKNGESLDGLLVEAFAVVREASKRTLGQRHFDVQMKGGIVLHRGMVTEMKTGEGKTLVATLPVYLNALTGKGIHVITVNDYLAKRDSQEMGKIYKFLGLSVGCIVNDLTDNQRKKAYASDITYGTNNEFGFDYLRDNMKFHIDDMCQRTLNFAIVDEVDSILIDEARTPLIISGPAEESSELYVKVNKVIPKLIPEDYEKDEKSKNVSLTEAGNTHIEQLLKKDGLMQGDKLYTAQNSLLVHHVNQALKAHIMFHKDVDYIVNEDDEVLIVDEFTGRVLPGRRYSDGLHQALEAKENVNVEIENQTLASITFQNYFRMYGKIAGMTGTAMTEQHEFEEIYKLQSVAIPTNKPMIRNDMDDEIFRTYEEKTNAVVDVVKDAQKRGQPVLVGTISIEKSELFSKAFKKAGIIHNVLNARHHEKEAYIIAKAGVPGAVTIATNMAGRGTDIKLGGNIEMQIEEALQGIEDEEQIAKISEEIRKKIDEDVKIARKAGGLFVVGTERHDSRRVDNQLRGRSGRQGDPGASKFFISLHDDLMRIFGPNIQLLDRWFSKMDVEKDGPIKHPWITKSIEKAQQRVEAQNFDTRKHLLRYSEVLNRQRISVYDKRLEMIEKTDLRDELEGLVDETLENLISMHTNEKTLPDNWDLDSLSKILKRIFNINLDLVKLIAEKNLSPVTLNQYLKDIVMQTLASNDPSMGEEEMRHFEKTLLIRNFDSVWKEHISHMDHLRHGVHLQAYGQKDPLNVYKHEGFMMFKAMIAQWREKTLSFLSNFKPQEPDEVREASFMMEDDDNDFSKMLFLHPEAKSALEEASSDDAAIPAKKPVRRRKKPAVQIESSSGSRNALCDCGSGLRYKHCHGKISDK